MSERPLHSPLKPPLPSQKTPSIRWGGLKGFPLSLAVSQAADAFAGLVVVVTEGMQQSHQIESELKFFGGKTPVLSLPDWETLPFDLFSPHDDIVSERLATLYRMPELATGILVVSVATLMQRLAPRAFLGSRALMLEIGDVISEAVFRERLELGGYRHVPQVYEHGEFAIRGSLIDLFPMGSQTPFRIDLFDNEVESIRIFDPETQRTIEQIDRIQLLPAREFPVDDDAIKLFRKQFRDKFGEPGQKSRVYRDVSKGMMLPGVEYYQPLFFEGLETLFDYLPGHSLFVLSEGVDAARQAFSEQIHERYELRRLDPERPLVEPGELYLNEDELEQGFCRYRRIAAGAEADESSTTFGCRPLPNVALNVRSHDPAATLRSFVEDFSGRILLVAESAGRREALKDQLGGYRLRPSVVGGWHQFLASERALCLTEGPVVQGQVLDDPQVALISEADLYGDKVRQRRRRKGQARDADAILRDLGDLNLGAPVVHEEHGVGRYRGLQTLTVGGVETEFLTLEYAGEDKLYVPVSSLHLISRYSGASPENAPLHRLGSDQWRKLKRRAQERLHDVAAELLDIQARRHARVGHAFDRQEAEYQAFADGFPFEETPDQQTAIDAVVDDLASPRPMDRVVCGDVGFGKTEVAMRAAFIAANSGKQVVVLVPTTLLAQQHYENFLDRFADWPFRIESLSRFSTTKQQRQILEALSEGRIDIIIGTHKLLSDQIRFKELGLVIVDEEHRFGVRHKERLKQLRAEVDLLTLTATPIPRTLNMTLSGLRDLSIIATPPAQRLAVKTFVGEWDDGLIKEACLRELKRGGQVYFLHNEVETIQRMAERIEAILPEARIRVAHGQMRERELEEVMRDFYHQRFNILVCTTIVESGIDVPTANTIVINRADKLGLAQLHQLRGRVGRSHHRAYAYLLAPPKKVLTADAVKRLEAIESLEELGVGFTLSTHDLEIRGAGELLGEGQSGQIHEIGFTLYTDLLDRAVKSMRSGQMPDLEQPQAEVAEVDLRLPALLPEDYVPDVHTRLILYKRIAGAKDSEALRELQVELIDRFGLLPEATKNLFAVTKLKLHAAELGIRKVEMGVDGGRVIFGPHPAVDPAHLIGLIQAKPDRYRFDGNQTLRVFMENLDEATDRVTATEQLLNRLTAPEPDTA
mgnify:CR=1 FL=1